MNELLSRIINGVKVWHLLASHAVMVAAGVALTVSIPIGMGIIAAGLIFALVLTIKNG